MKWKIDEIEKAIELHNQGKRFEEIAIVLKRTSRSVQTKLNGLGYGEIKISSNENLTCIECGKNFIGLKKDSRKFCSQSCSACYNNKNRPKQAPIVKNKSSNKTCSTKYGTKKRYNEIENGNTCFGPKAYKKYLIQKFGNKCMKCGWNEVNPVTGLVPIQLEHKDGNSENHNLSNLELLCPNCHSLTSTYGALNKGNGRTKRREKRHEKSSQN